MQEHIKDPWVRQAQTDGYRARAAYKLIQIDEAEHLLRPGMRVVDLGAAPGAWSQYLQRRLRPEPDGRGRIISLDLLPMDAIAGVHFLQGDFRDDEVLRQLEELLEGQKLDLVVSDMAPNLSGVAASDAARVSHLVELALDFAVNWLQADGALLTKLFHGSGYSQLVALFKQRFRQVKAIKPAASRSRSSETFLLGRYLKRDPVGVD